MVARHRGMVLNRDPVRFLVLIRVHPRYPFHPRFRGLRFLPCLSNVLYFTKSVNLCLSMFICGCLHPVVAFAFILYLPLPLLLSCICLYPVFAFILYLPLSCSSLCLYPVHPLILKILIQTVFAFILFIL